MAIFVIDFLEAMQVEHDDAQWQDIAPCAIQLFFECFDEEPPIVEARQWIGYSAQLQLLEFVVLEHNRHANQAGRGEHVHQHGFQRDRAAELFGHLFSAREHFFPQLQALALAQIKMCRCLKISLKKLAARGNIHLLERVYKQLEIGIFHRQTRGRRGSGTGHDWVFPKICLPRGVWGGAYLNRWLSNEQAKCQSISASLPVHLTRTALRRRYVITIRGDKRVVPEGKSDRLS